MKIAKILLGNPANQKGFFNNVMERTKHLMEVESDVDCYMIRLEYGLVLRLLKRQLKKTHREEFSTVEGIKFKNLWLTMGLFDYLLTNRLNMRAIVALKQLDKYTQLFKSYDLLSTHGMEATFLAFQVKNKFNIPFVTTWHGSDINVIPFRSSSIKNAVKQLLDSAYHNFFVSQKLLETSEKISIKAKKSVLYTGPAKSFYRYDEDEQQALREKYNINTKYVVGFIGNFVAIKNVLVLPLLFKKLQDELQDISFVVVGNGDLGSQLSNGFDKHDIKNLQMLGNQDPGKVPDIMNCLDVLVLPSLNEGMPRVTLEAQACGVYVVGSDRGGIPEAIGNENCFELDSYFVNRSANRICELLKEQIELTKLPEIFSWSSAILEEQTVYKNAQQKI